MACEPEEIGAAFIPPISAVCLRFCGIGLPACATHRPGGLCHKNQDTADILTRHRHRSGPVQIAGGQKSSLKAICCFAIIREHSRTGANCSRALFCAHSLQTRQSPHGRQSKGSEHRSRGKGEGSPGEHSVPNHLGCRRRVHRPYRRQDAKALDQDRAGRPSESRVVAIRSESGTDHVPVPVTEPKPRSRRKSNLLPVANARSTSITEPLARCRRPSHSSRQPHPQKPRRGHLFPRRREGVAIHVTGEAEGVVIVNNELKESLSSVES